MKIRSLLLGSVAAAGLSTAGFAADLGVVTSLDVCDELGLSGLTISSDDNCLAISGNVSIEYSIGDYATATVLSLSRDDAETIEPFGATVTDLDVDAWLKFVATAGSDFGPATATIKLLVLDSYDGVTLDPVEASEAWVGIGDTTMIMAGLKGSIFNDGDDTPLNYLGLFNADGVSGTGGPVTDDGVAIQLVHNLGNGLSIGGGVEQLTAGPAVDPVYVGVLAYAGDGISAHVSGAADGTGLWSVHAGFKGTWDPITVVGAVAADESSWQALGSVSATFDMFTLAVSGDATDAGEYGIGASVGATVADGVTLNVGGRWADNGVDTATQVEAGVSAAVTETITLTAAIGGIAGTENPAVDNVYVKGGLAWAPGGGFTASVAGEANSLGAYKGTFKAAKSIK